MDKDYNIWLIYSIIYIWFKIFILDKQKENS